MKDGTVRHGIPARIRPAPARSRKPPRRFRLGAALVAALSASLLWAAPCVAGQMRFAITQIGSDTGGICGRDCIEVISAQGEIDGDTADRFTTFLSNHQQEQNLRPVILLDSPGGTVVGAMKLGTAFRNMGAEVVVGEAAREPGTDRMGLSSGLCMSACVYAFFGGAQRVVPNNSRLGIHRMVINEAVRDPAGGFATQQTFGSDEIVATLSAYTKMMGIDPGVILQAERVSPESIRILTPKEIARWRLARSRF